MSELGKALVVMGAVALLAGAVLWGLGRIGFRGLPGDIHYESQHLRVYFPIVTCLVISAIMTLISWLFRGR